MEIREGGLGDPAVEALLALHRREAHASTPIDNAHALDSASLAAPGIRFFSAWDGADLLGVAALRPIDTASVEVKSMRTAPAHLRKGVARALLTHLIGAARADGFARLDLETGTAPMFAPANRMYEAHGFRDCAAFGGYRPSPHNRFMSLAL